MSFGIHADPKMNSNFRCNRLGHRFFQPNRDKDNPNVFSKHCRYCQMVYVYEIAVDRATRTYKTTAYKFSYNKNFYQPRAQIKPVENDQTKTVDEIKNDIDNIVMTMKRA